MAEGEGRPVSTYFRVMAAFALAPVHAGMWLWEDLSQDYCVRCRRWLSFLSVVMGGLTVSLGFLAIRWAHRAGLL